MGILDKATSGIRTRPRRILLYGTHGIGKTTWASCAPAALIIDAEKGSGDVDVAGRLSEDEGIDSFPAVLEVIEELLADKHAYETLAIDTLDWIEQLIWDAVCQEHNVKTIEDIGFKKGYLFAINHWRELLAGLQTLRDQRGMTIILLAHCAVIPFKNPESDVYDRYEPKLHKHASAIVQDWCDEVLFATYRTFTKTEDLGFNKKRTVGIGAGERVLRTVEKPSHLAKNRLGLPEELPLEWAAYAEAVEAARADSAAK